MHEKHYGRQEGISPTGIYSSPFGFWPSVLGLWDFVLCFCSVVFLALRSEILDLGSQVQAGEPRPKLKIKYDSQGILEAPGRGGSGSRGPITPCDEGVTYGVSNGHWSGQRPMSLVQVED
jgi:hypothetical protein